MKKEINPEYLKLITDANDDLMEQEHHLERLRCAVSAARHYLAANPCRETVLDLRGAMANLRAQQATTDKARNLLESLVQEVFYHMEGKEIIFQLNDNSMQLIRRLKSVHQRFSGSVHGRVIIEHAARAINARLDMKMNRFAMDAVINAATLWYDNLENFFQQGTPVSVHWDGYVTSKK